MSANIIRVKGILAAVPTLPALELTYALHKVDSHD